MTTYVLIHGGWHGGWCWKKLTPILRNAGHEVFVPTLTGHGERLHLLSPEVDMTTHINDVVGVLEYEDLQEVILVGHSYGGLVITGVSQKAANRLAHLVFLDAIVPQNGQAHSDINPELVNLFEQQAIAAGDGWKIPVPQDWDFGIVDEADLKWVQSKLTPHPLKTNMDPIELTSSAALALPRTYIICTKEGERSSLARFAEEAPSKQWVVRELEAGHDAMITSPNALADMLLDLA